MLPRRDGRTDGRTDGQTRKDRATQLLIRETLSFAIFGLCSLKGHIMEIRLGVTLEDNARTTECEDRARILETEFAIQHFKAGLTILTNFHLYFCTN